MSLSKLEEVTCPCGEVFEAELWNAINATEDPDLREALLSGEINIVCCPSCGQIFYAEHFILYQDVASELLAFVYPSSFALQAAQCASKMDEDFRRAMDEFMPEERLTYKPILLFGLNSLVNIIRVEEELSDEARVLEYIAGDLGLALIRLRPSLARPRHLPRLLPFVPAKSGAARGTREQIIAGLHRLLKHNPNLTHYREFLATVEQNTAWAVDRDLVEKEKTIKGKGAAAPRRKKK